MTFLDWVDSLHAEQLRATGIVQRVLTVTRRGLIHEVTDLPKSMLYVNWDEVARARKNGTTLPKLELKTYEIAGRDATVEEIVEAMRYKEIIRRKWNYVAHNGPLVPYERAMPQ